MGHDEDSGRLAAFAVAAAIAAPAAAQELTEEQQAIAVEFALNNSIFVLQHEIGHLFVGEFNLPVLGKEEDAADSLASVMLLSQENETSDQALRDAADGWYLSEYSQGRRIRGLRLLRRAQPRPSAFATPWSA